VSLSLTVLEPRPDVWEFAHASTCVLEFERVDEVGIPRLEQLVHSLFD
jgi:hypothetical protein